MNKAHAILLLATGILLSACSSGSTLKYFEQDTHFERAMHNLRTGTMVMALETKAILHAIYLNAVDPQTYSEGEYFFIGTYIDNDFYDQAKQGLFNPQYWLKLNGIEALHVQELDEHSELRKNMPLLARWNRYFLVKFPPATTDALTLTFSNVRFGKITLQYDKLAQER